MKFHSSIIFLFSSLTCLINFTEANHKGQVNPDVLYVPKVSKQQESSGYNGRYYPKIGEDNFVTAWKPGQKGYPELPYEWNPKRPLGPVDPVGPTTTKPWTSTRWSKYTTDYTGPSTQYPTFWPTSSSWSTTTRPSTTKPTTTTPATTTATTTTLKPTTTEPAPTTTRWGTSLPTTPQTASTTPYFDGSFNATMDSLSLILMNIIDEINMNKNPKKIECDQHCDDTLKETIEIQMRIIELVESSLAREGANQAVGETVLLDEESNLISDSFKRRAPTPSVLFRQNKVQTEAKKQVPEINSFKRSSSNSLPYVPYKGQTQDAFVPFPTLPVNKQQSYMPYNEPNSGKVYAGNNNHCLLEEFEKLLPVTGAKTINQLCRPCWLDCLSTIKDIGQVNSYTEWKNWATRQEYHYFRGWGTLYFDRKRNLFFFIIFKLKMVQK